MTPNKLVAIDFETYYDKEYSLSKMSVYQYTHDERFDAYLVSIHNDDLHYVGSPADFDWSLLDGMTPCAHNATFDLSVYERIVELGIVKTPPVFAGPWVCTSDMVAYLGCKRDLKTASKIFLGRNISKSTRTKARGVSGADLVKDEEMLKYSGNDAVLCYDLAVAQLPNWPAKERKISDLNRETSMLGFPLDYKLVKAGIDTLTPELEAVAKTMPWLWDAEGNRIEEKSPLSALDLREYGTSVGVVVPSSTSKADETFLNWVEEYGEANPWVQAVGKYRSINSLLNRVQSLHNGYNPTTGRFPYEKKYFGAITGRFSGGSVYAAGNKFNMENMPRNVMFGVDVRPMFIASPGHTLIIADYSQIEARCLLWRAGDEESLELLRGTDMSVYQAYAERTGLANEGSDLKRLDSNLYNYVKAKVLAGGYQAGSGSFQSQARVMTGLVLTDQEAKEAVFEYRRENPKITSYWAGHQDMLAYSTRLKDDTHQVELASGRILTYWKPAYGSRGIEVYQVLGGSRTNMYGGKLTENEMQATCRDVLCDAWLNLDKHGYKVLLTVHDEIVTEVPTDEAEDHIPEIERLMTTCSDWAEGFPLKVDIVTTPVYVK